jgi:hypothetical protein
LARECIGPNANPGILGPLHLTPNYRKTFRGYFLYGYRANEVNLKIPTTPDSTSYALHKNFFSYDSSTRPPMAACFVNPIPAIPPRPDVTNPHSSLIGIAKRMAYSPPKYDPKLRRKFRKFVSRWLKENMTPIDPVEDFDLEEWLQSTNYPDWRKEEIRKVAPKGAYVHGEVDRKDNKFDDDDDLFNINLFTKEEYYPEYKHHRGIWARSDKAKSVMGPFFRKIEKALFSLPYFIKKIPKNERPKYINEFMNSNLLQFQGTDYTSFESLFTTDMMDDCEFQLYRYMSSLNPEAQQRCRLIFKVLASQNFAKNKYFTVKVDAKRMSGEMNTSLGNGFSNLMFLLFACHYYKKQFTGPIIEGDDALIGLNSRIPDEYYVKMGLNVKMEFIEDISEGSFCGLVYDPEELFNIRDPREPLCTTSWVPKKYTFSNRDTYYSLLRSKALSLIYEYPGCPIIYKYGRKIFDMLSKYEIRLRYEDSYKQEHLLAAYERYITDSLPKGEPGPRTRLLMEKMFNISVAQQLRIESEIDLMTEDNFNLPTVLEIMPDCWINNFDNYVNHSKFQDYGSLTHPEMIPYKDLDVDKIIKLNKVKLMKKVMLSASEYYSSKKNKDPKLYEDYVSRWRDAQFRLKKNSRVMVQRATE